MRQYFLRVIGLSWIAALLVLGGCTSVNTFPHIARPGDTVSLMVGGSAQARKENVSATLTDVTGQTFDLQALGLVRSVFNLRTDGRAYGTHYSPYVESFPPWFFGHEPLQTMLVTDLPASAAPGAAVLTVALHNVSDDSTAMGGSPISVALEILPGSGQPEQFLRGGSDVGMPVEFDRLETAPYAEISFSSGVGETLIGAASVVIDFDETVVNPDDVNLYVPEATVRRELPTREPFGKTQRMVYWHQDGQKLYVDIVAPQGISNRYLKFYALHPRGLPASPGFSLLSAQVYDTSGNPIALQPSLSYSP